MKTFLIVVLCCFTLSSCSSLRVKSFVDEAMMACAESDLEKFEYKDRKGVKLKFACQSSESNDE